MFVLWVQYWHDAGIRTRNAATAANELHTSRKNVKLRSVFICNKYVNAAGCDGTLPAADVLRVPREACAGDGAGPGGVHCPQPRVPAGHYHGSAAPRLPLPGRRGPQAAAGGALLL